jgi:RNA polymerase sigma-70 factor (ECF subfamily)
MNFVILLKIMEVSDQNLITNYLEGDEKSLEILYSRYIRPIYKFVYGYIENQQDTEDIVQEVFIKTWRNLKKFDKSKSFKTWIFTIAKNTTIDFLRKKQTISLSRFISKYSDEKKENIFIENFIDPNPLPQEAVEKYETMEKINSAIKKLPQKDRMILSLRHKSLLSFKEISRSLKEPLHTTTSRYRRAINKLKNLLS